MEKNEIKNFIARHVREGVTLSKIQDMLTEQGVRMTFMELRLIASEIENEVFKANEVTTPEPAAAPAEAVDAVEAAPSSEMTGFPPESPAEPAPEGAVLRGKTSVSISPIQRPGYVASGTVTFGSGASGDWLLDQTGRLGFENINGKPDQQDVREFQSELQKAFGA